MKAIKVVVLVAVILAALIFGLSKSGVFSGGVPTEVAGRGMPVIDVETLEMREVTMMDWEQRFGSDSQTGYKIDNQGRKVSAPAECANCGEQIPQAPISADIEDPEEQRRIISGYRCPRCGEPAVRFGL